MNDIEKYFDKVWTKKVYSLHQTITTAMTPFFDGTIATDEEGLLLSLATDNSVDGQIDFRIAGKSVADAGFPMDITPFPASLEDLIVAVPIPSGQKYEILARMYSGSSDLPLRAVVLTRKKV